MPAALISALEPALSTPRLTRYRVTNSDAPETVLARYLWNVSLCEALYPTLHAFEIALRNSVSRQLVADYGPNWYRSKRFNGSLHQGGRNRIQDAIDELSKNGKAVTGDTVTAELSFGFWVSLFWSRHDPYWHGGQRLANVFPGLTTKYRNAPYVLGEISIVRDLRNRVFHHERIYDDPTLTDKHIIARKLMRWINPKVEALLDDIDKFDSVYASTHSPYEATVKRLAAPPAPRIP